MDPKATIRALFAALNDRDPEKVLALAHDDYADRDPLPGLPADKAGLSGKLGALFTAFPDITYELQELVAEGDVCAARSRFTATQTGPFLGLEPTGLRVGVAGMDFYRVREGKIVEHWHVLDMLGLLMQLGKTPSCPSPG